MVGSVRVRGEAAGAPPIYPPGVIRSSVHPRRAIRAPEVRPPALAVSAVGNAHARRAGATQHQVGHHAHVQGQRMKPFPEYCGALPSTCSGPRLIRPAGPCRNHAPELHGTECPRCPARSPAGPGPAHGTFPLPVRRCLRTSTGAPDRVCVSITPSFCLSPIDPGERSSTRWKRPTVGGQRHDCGGGWLGSGTESAG